MRRFWKRGELDIEGELRAARPEPADELVQAVERRVARSHRPRGARLVFASVLTIFALVPFAALGGFGAVSDAVAHHKPNHGGGPPPSKPPKPPKPPKDKQYKPQKVTICHKPGTPAEKTKRVPESAVPGHQRHGDTLGPCP